MIQSDTIVERRISLEQVRRRGAQALIPTRPNEVMVIYCRNEPLGVFVPWELWQEIESTQKALLQELKELVSFSI